MEKWDTGTREQLEKEKKKKTNYRRVVSPVSPVQTRMGDNGGTKKKK